MNQFGNARVSRAVALAEFDIVMDIYECSNFVEIVGKTGSAIITKRIYDDGIITCA